MATFAAEIAIKGHSERETFGTFQVVLSHVFHQVAVIS